MIKGKLASKAGSVVTRLLFIHIICLFNGRYYSKIALFGRAVSKKGRCRDLVTIPIICLFNGRY